MNLTKKIVLWSTLLSMLILLIGILSVWNITSMIHTTRAASAEYQAMDRADALLGQVVWLRDSLLTTDARTYRDIRFFAPIQKEVSTMVGEIKLAASVDDGDSNAEFDLARASSEHLDAAVEKAVGGQAALAT